MDFCIYACFYDKIIDLFFLVRFKTTYAQYPHTLRYDAKHWAENILIPMN